MKSTLYSGDSISETIISTDYPASAGWTHKTRFAPLGGSGTAVTVTASTAADGESYVLSVSTTVTSGWPQGNWTYTQWVEKSGERHTIATGSFSVLADPSTATSGIDTRSHVKKTLDALELMIEGKANRDVQSYTINNRQLQHYEFSELIVLRDKYRAYYAREERKKSGKTTSGRKIYVRI